MIGKNRYKKVAHFSERKMRTILKCFANDLSATETSLMSNLSRQTINKIYCKLRHRIMLKSLVEGREEGIFELDESYFGAKRVRGKRGRGAAGKTPVFGLLKRDGNVYVSIVQNCSREELMPIIQGKILEGSEIHTDGWRAYNGLILNGYTHHRVHHSENEFVRGKSHVNGIEAFWSYAKRRLAKFNGLSDNHFALHLKECEWRFNHRMNNTYKILLKMLRQNPL
jgi:transposase-like protein